MKFVETLPVFLDNKTKPLIHTNKNNKYTLAKNVTPNVPYHNNAFL